MYAVDWGETDTEDEAELQDAVKINKKTNRKKRFISFNYIKRRLFNRRMIESIHGKHAGGLFSPKSQLLLRAIASSVGHQP